MSEKQKMNQMQLVTDISKTTEAGSGSWLNSIFVLFEVFPKVIMEKYKEILYFEPDMVGGNECFLWSWFEFQALSIWQDLACVESSFVLNQTDMTIYDTHRDGKKNPCHNRGSSVDFNGVSHIWIRLYLFLRV